MTCSEKIKTIDNKTKNTELNMIFIYKLGRFLVYQQKILINLNF